MWFSIFFCLVDYTKKLHTIDNLQIVSAGRVWYGWPESSYKAKNNAKNKWGDLAPGERTKGQWSIEVIVEEELPESLYNDYTLYYLQDEGQDVFKNKFIENKQ